MSSLHLGYGVSAWSRGAVKGHLDGIGIYTQALFHALMRHADFQLTPYAFGDQWPSLPCGQPLMLEKRVSLHLLTSALFHRRLQCDVDVFHATDHFIPRLNVPVIATVMDLIPFLYPAWVSRGLRRFKNHLLKKSILSADHIITISEYSKRDLMQHFHLPAHQITVTPLGVDACYFERVTEEQCQQVLQRHGLNGHFFLFVGTIQPRKNLEKVLDAHALLPLSLQRAYPLVIVGQYGWGVPHLITKIRALSQSGVVRWLDYLPRTDVLALLQCARALLFVSQYEGFGLPVIEAFAAQCPVVTSNTTSLPEVAGDAACLVDPMNQHAIANAMTQCIEDDAFIASLREKGLARAKLFSWDACAKATWEAYQTLC